MHKAIRTLFSKISLEIVVRRFRLGPAETTHCFDDALLETRPWILVGDGFPVLFLVDDDWCMSVQGDRIPQKLFTVLVPLAGGRLLFDKSPRGISAIDFETLIRRDEGIFHIPA